MFMKLNDSNLINSYKAVHKYATAVPPMARSEEEGVWTITTGGPGVPWGAHETRNSGMTLENTRLIF